MEGTVFSVALKSARTEKGWSRLQAYINSLHISPIELFTPDTLEKWEAGKAIPMSIERIVGLAELYGKPELIDIRIAEAKKAIKKAPLVSGSPKEHWKVD